MIRTHIHKVIVQDERFFEPLLARAETGYAVVDADGYIHYFNTVAGQVLFRSDAEILGGHLEQLLQDDLAMAQPFDKIQSYIAKALSDEDEILYIGTPVFSRLKMTTYTVSLRRLAVDAQAFCLISLQANVEEKRDKAFYHIFESTLVPQMILTDTLKVEMINNAFIKRFHLGNCLLGVTFNETFQCRELVPKECVGVDKRLFCAVHSQLKNFIESRTLLKDYLLKIHLDENTEDVWLNINILQIERVSTPYLLISFEDVTERVLLDEHVRSARIDSLKLLDELPTLIFYLSSKETCDYVNEAFTKFVPIRKVNFMRQIESLMPEESFSRFEAGITHLFQGAKYKDEEVQLLNKDGTYRTMHCSLKPVYYDHESFYGVIGMFIDVHERTVLERDLIREKEHSEAANKAKSTFLANMSHEIRTPLNGILGMIDLTLMDGLAPEQLENLVTAKNCASSLLEIINDILDISKIEAGKLSLRNTSFDLKMLVVELIKAHQTQAFQKGLFLEYSYYNIKHWHLYGDSARIKQVFNNLLSNAIKFTHSGSITLKVYEEPSGDSKQCILVGEVIDTGIGIPMEKREMLFKRFSQVDASFTREYGGTGLGLVITKELLMLMGGDITFESRGRGTIFKFRLPVTIGREVMPINAPLKVLTKLPDKRVLVVEDDLTNQIVLGKMLENLSIQYKIASQGDEALKLCEAEAFDAIFMDIQMPVLDGIQATKRIRRDNKLNAHVPIIALTAYALEGDEALFRASGMDDYIPKPISFSGLAEIISKHLSMPSELNNFRREADSIDSMSSPLNDQQVSGITHQLESLKRFLEAMQYEKAEVLAHQIKMMLESIHADGLKAIAFKIELDLRKAHYSDAQSKLLDLMASLKQLENAQTEEANNGENINR